MKSKYLLYAIPALLLAACSNEEPATGPASDGAAVVTADIAGIAKSRAHDNAWDSGDQIGISGSTGTVAYVNVPYTTSGDGSFSASNGVENGIFFQNKETATFSAYYPYNAGVTADNTEIAANTADQSKSKEFDFLFANGANGSVANPAINFTGDAAFSHKMTQLVIKVTPDENAGFEASTALSNGTSTLCGLKSAGSFDTATGVAAASGDDADWTLNGNVSPSVDGTTLTFAMIIFPQETVDGVTYRIDYDGATYSCTLTPELAAGKRYTYNVTLKKTGLTVASSEITDWEDEPAEDVDADMEPPFTINGHEAVLMRAATETEAALYFATCNLGATTPYEAGLYFWWSDVVGQTPDEGLHFAHDNVPTYIMREDELKAHGYIDDSLNLTSTYDAAHQQWGGQWRLPTKADIEWLIDSNNCTWHEQVQSDVDGRLSGYIVTSTTTGNSIFIAEAGIAYDSMIIGLNSICNYVTSTFHSDSNNYSLLYTHSPNLGVEAQWQGGSIRPVATL